MTEKKNENKCTVSIQLTHEKLSMCDSEIENSHPKSFGTKKFRCEDQIIQLSECIEWMKAIFDKRMNVIYGNIRRNIINCFQRKIQVNC